MNPPVKDPGAKNLDPSFQKQLLHSRLGIGFVAIVFGIISLLSIGAVVFNLSANYPGTNRPVIVVDPLWMAGNVIRAIGLGILTFHLWRYQVAIKHWPGPDAKGTEDVILTQAAVWKTGAIVLGLLLVFAVIYVVSGAPSSG